MHNQRCALKQIQGVKRNIYLLLFALKERAGSAGLHITLPSSFMSSKEGANFGYSYKYHCLEEYYKSQKFRGIIFLANKQMQLAEKCLKPLE